MHGRPRKSPTHEEQEASALKADKIRHLQSQLLRFHRDKIFTEEALECSAKLLEVNPEHYTGWNYRKLAVQHILHQESENATEFGSIKSILDEELKVVETALRTNIKSYGAWHHRKWVLSKGYSSMDRELKILGKFQKLDARNFHAWNYRRFVTALMKIPNEEELKYVTDMIGDNFSNYSAWHNRSMLLSQLLESKVKENSDKENILQEEYDTVRHSFFTDPDDQSSWFYHLWLLDQTMMVATLMLSSWPPHGSNVYISADHCLDDQRSIPLLAFCSKSRAFPLILYFSEPVEGVSSSTVTLECEYLTDSELIWSPLSTNKSGFAQAWVTSLKFTDKTHTLEALSVTVTVAHCLGIVSSKGTVCNQCVCISFMVHMLSNDQNNPEGQVTDRIFWSEENFCAYAAQSHNASSLHAFCKRAMMREEPQSFEWSMKVIDKEIEYFRELLSLAECKIGKLTLARLLMASNTLVSHSNPKGRSDVHFEEVLELYDSLMKQDTVHICYYEDERSVVLLKQMTSNLESVLKHSYQYKESTSMCLNPYSCLRLNSLSLSRIGTVECLLWVQMLDLSHNRLRSVEGLEPLQLLSCLNFSYNKICSFSVLEPLKLLKSLQVLDVSYNEIGAHSIDTRRYLFSSPLNNALNSDGFPNTEWMDCWDAFLIFKDLKLIQLDIMGNPVADNQLKSSIIKLMPSLKWIDGQKSY